jgi:hypothetical protein
MLSAEYAKCHYPKCHYAEFHGASTVTLAFHKLIEICQN